MFKKLFNEVVNIPFALGTIPAVLFKDFENSLSPAWSAPAKPEDKTLAISAGVTTGLIVFAFALNPVMGALFGSALYCSGRIAQSKVLSLKGDQVIKRLRNKL